MLTSIVLAGWLVAAQQASMSCANVVTAHAQTEPVRGPKGTSALVKISSADDHAKDTHLCMAEYQIVVSRMSANQPQSAALMDSDGDWGRDLKVELNGFSQDGKEILGLLSEDGAYPVQQVFKYNTGDGTVQITDLRAQLARVLPKKCRPSAQVVGTDSNGQAVLELTSSDGCVVSGRWLVDFDKGQLKRISLRTSVLELYP